MYEYFAVYFTIENYIEIVFTFHNDSYTLKHHIYSVLKDSTPEIKEGATYQPAVDLEPSQCSKDEIPSQLQYSHQHGVHTL